MEKDIAGIDSNGFFSVGAFIVESPKKCRQSKFCVCLYPIAGAQGAKSRLCISRSPRPMKRDPTLQKWLKQTAIPPIWLRNQRSVNVNQGVMFLVKFASAFSARKDSERRSGLEASHLLSREEIFELFELILSRGVGRRQILVRYAKAYPCNGWLSTNL